MNEIPRIISDKAQSLGFNHVEYIGLQGGGEAFSVSLTDDNGDQLPVGLPVILVLKSGRVTVINGIEAMNLL